MYIHYLNKDSKKLDEKIYLNFGTYKLIDKSVDIVAFFDDNEELWGRSICGKNIYSPKLISSNSSGEINSQLISDCVTNRDLTKLKAICFTKLKMV